MLRRGNGIYLGLCPFLHFFQVLSILSMLVSISNVSLRGEFCTPLLCIVYIRTGAKQKLSPHYGVVLGPRSLSGRVGRF